MITTIPVLLLPLILLLDQYYQSYNSELYMQWGGGTMISQAAVQQEQQQNSSRFGCWFHHDPDLQAETQNQIQQIPCLVLLCLNLSLSLCVGGILTRGSKYELDWWVGHV